MDRVGPECVHLESRKPAPPVRGEGHAKFKLGVDVASGDLRHCAEDFTLVSHMPVGHSPNFLRHHLDDDFHPFCPSIRQVMINPIHQLMNMVASGRRRTSSGDVPVVGLHHLCQRDAIVLRPVSRQTSWWPCVGVPLTHVGVTLVVGQVISVVVIQPCSSR